MKVSLFIPCFIDRLMPHVGVSIVKVLERLGCEVDYPEGQTCCGQPACNSGYWDEARDVAEHATMSAFTSARDSTSARNVRPLLAGACPGDDPRRLVALWYISATV